MERVNHGTANIFVFYKVHGVWLTGSISPCRSVVSVYVAAGSEEPASKDATSAAGAPFPPCPLPPLSILRNSAPRFFILLFPRYICIYIFEVRKKEGRSVSGRRCGLVDERYHPVMVYLNQSSGSLLGVGEKEKERREKAC